MIPTGFEILPPWSALPVDRAELLTVRLQRELPRGHALYGITARAVASRTDRDDVLFELESSSMQLAVVHLTWRVETDPRWPSSKLFCNWQEWAAQEMYPNHDEFTL
jgi:hypothetical protein